MFLEIEGLVLDTRSAVVSVKMVRNVKEFYVEREGFFLACGANSLNPDLGD